ncbi:hypothetical protein C1H46_045789 [Malus baccata]|uniref:Uncharacterized protein n=1 Tax=Malus baccata TaxID=106549 RepID=A0A540K338_MALBA|nr:hypothetical protein C1H46_045789 [Malus baccata]
MPHEIIDVLHTNKESLVRTHFTEQRGEKGWGRRKIWKIGGKRENRGCYKYL